MHKTILAGAVLASALSAQNDAMFYFNVATGATTRGAAGVNANQQITRYDHEDYVGWGNPVLDPVTQMVTGYELTGLRFVLQDQNDSTPESYSVHMYAEDPTNPNFPNCPASSPAGTNSIATFGPFTQATTGTVGGTISAFIYTMNFATPAVRPAGQDFFPAIELAANAGWAGTDGGSVHISLGINPNFPPPNTNTYDLKGAGQISGGITNNSYGMAHDLLNMTQSWGGARQYHILPLVAATVGRSVVTAITSQGTYPTSNIAPGTASFFSGLHPDVFGTNGGRTDDIGQVVFGAAAGDILFWLASFNRQTPELPLSFLLPGGVGVACVDIANNVSLGFTIASGSGQDSNILTFTPAQRVNALGADVTFQCLALNPATFAAVAAPCGTQHF